MQVSHPRNVPFSVSRADGMWNREMSCPHQLPSNLQTHTQNHGSCCFRILNSVICRRCLEQETGIQRLTLATVYLDALFTALHRRTWLYEAIEQETSLLGYATREGFTEEEKLELRLKEVSVGKKQLCKGTWGARTGAI